jgi:LDH2 family malate/lactate/ureidoglycolate dehydrogenase
VALLPFGAHKGYGLGLIDELYAGYIGGRCRKFAERSWAAKARSAARRFISKSSIPTR